MISDISGIDDQPSAANVEVEEIEEGAEGEEGDEEENSYLELYF